MAVIEITFLTLFYFHRLHELARRWKWENEREKHRHGGKLWENNYDLTSTWKKFYLLLPHHEKHTKIKNMFKNVNILIQVVYFGKDFWKTWNPEISGARYHTRPLACWTFAGYMVLFEKFYRVPMLRIIISQISLIEFFIRIVKAYLGLNF